MAVSIEDILLARSMEEQSEGMRGLSSNLGDMSPYVGGIGGGIIGAAIGEAGLIKDKARERITDDSIGGQIRRGVTPGKRMAGGLVGAILGGALGEGAKQLMVQNSPSAELLAKLQVTGDLSPQDTKTLQYLLSDTYSNIAG